MSTQTTENKIPHARTLTFDLQQPWSYMTHPPKLIIERNGSMVIDPVSACLRFPWFGYFHGSHVWKIREQSFKGQSPKGTLSFALITPTKIHMFLFANYPLTPPELLPDTRYEIFNFNKRYSGETVHDYRTRLFEGLAALINPHNGQAKIGVEFAHFQFFIQELFSTMRVPERYTCFLEFLQSNSAEFVGHVILDESDGETRRPGFYVSHVDHYGIVVKKKDRPESQRKWEGDTSDRT